MEWTPDRRQGLQNHIFKSKLDKMFKYSDPYTCAFELCAEITKRRREPGRPEHYSGGHGLIFLPYSYLESLEFHHK